MSLNLLFLILKTIANLSFLDFNPHLNLNTYLNIDPYLNLHLNFNIYLNLNILDVTFPSILRLDEDLGVKTDELELAVPNLEDIDEYPEVNDVGPEVGSPSELLKMGGKDTG